MLSGGILYEDQDSTRLSSWTSGTRNVTSNYVYEKHLYGRTNTLVRARRVDERAICQHQVSREVKSVRDNYWAFEIS